MEIRSVTKIVGTDESGHDLYKFIFAVPGKDIDGNDIVLAREEVRTRESIVIDRDANDKRITDFTSAKNECQALIDAIDNIG
jgi:NMD protein affecting ribosome stability and mRNA decay